MSEGLGGEIASLREELKTWQERCTKEHIDHDMFDANHKLLARAAAIKEGESNE